MYRTVPIEIGKVGTFFDSWLDVVQPIASFWRGPNNAVIAWFTAP